MSKDFNDHVVVRRDCYRSCGHAKACISLRSAECPLIVVTNDGFQQRSGIFLHVVIVLFCTWLLVAWIDCLHAHQRLLVTGIRERNQKRNWWLDALNQRSVRVVKNQNTRVVLNRERVTAYGQ